MKIKIDTYMLDQQIHLLEEICCSPTISDEQINMIDKIENLLSRLIYAANGDRIVELEAINTKVPKGRMTIRELMSYEIDIDVVNNVTDSLGCCLVCPTELTEEGEREWGDVLNYIVNVYGDDNYAECIVDDGEPELSWNKKLRRLNRFLNSAAGYCSEDDYNKWFSDED
jgi:hypothetical protein